jgi:hypothetical protein
LPAAIGQSCPYIVKLTVRVPVPGIALTPREIICALPSGAISYTWAARLALGGASTPAVITGSPDSHTLCANGWDTDHMP